MDVSSRFSFADFLAFLFPGISALTGGYFLLLLTPLSASLAGFSPDLTTGILFLVLSYVVGVLVAGFAEITTAWFRRKNDHKIPLPGFEQEVEDAFKNTFDTKEPVQWTRIHFYLCRSLVFEHMPNQIQVIQRQSGLRQLRRNIAPAVFIWLAAGVGWGSRLYRQGAAEWGIELIMISLALGALFLTVTLDRMQKNDRQEIRETLTAFLCGYKTGLFARQKRSTPKAHLKD